MDPVPCALVASWLAGWWLFWRVPLLAGPPGDTPEPPGPPGPVERRVSVVVPARDEEANLPTLLASLATQDPPPTEVIVVDDHSSDATAGVAAAAGATVVAAPPLPAGWTGKSWAAWQGAQRAGGDVLVFVDADTAFAAGGLAAVVAAQAAAPGLAGSGLAGSGPGRLVSVQPWHRMVSPYEWCSAYFNVVATMATGMAAARRGTRVVGAFGPCLVCDRADYFARGGHEAVRGAILDDLALAERFGGARCFGGRRAVSYRMYPGGFRQLVEGWSKNFASGAGATPPVRRVLVAVWVGGSVVAAASAMRLPGGAALGGVPAGAAYLAFAAQLWVMLRQLGEFRATAGLFPAPLFAFLAIFARSLALTVRGRARWKGRDVLLRPGCGPRPRP